MTTATLDQFDWTEGGEGAVEAGKGSGGQFSRIEYFGMDDGDTLFLRFITDSPQWLYVDQHMAVPTKNPPADHKADAKWPTMMPAVCRYWKGWKGHFKDCYVCDSKMKDKWGKEMKPKSRVWAIACVREEVLGDGTEDMGGAAMKGKRIGFKDATREIEEKDEKGEPTGKKTLERRLIVINMSSFQFFDGLQSIYTTYGTVCDRDYIVRKQGDGKDAKYPILPMDPVAGCNPQNAEWWKKYDDAIAEQKINIKEIVYKRAEDEYWALFIDPNRTAAPSATTATATPTGQQGAPAEQQAVNSAPEPDADALAAMKERVRSHVPGPAPTPPADAAPASPPPPHAPPPAAPANTAPHGPFTRAALDLGDLGAMAFLRSSPSTIPPKKAWRAGRSKALTAPRSAPNDSTTQT